MEKKKTNAVPWGRMLVLTFGLVLLGQACQKEPLNTPLKTLAPNSGFEVENRVRDFIQFAADLPLTGKEKSGSITLDPEDAVWLVEASLNYAYVNPNESGTMLSWDSLIVSMTKEGDEVSEAEAARVFMAIFDSLFLKASLFGSSSKTLDMLDIRIKHELADEFSLEIAYSFSESTAHSPFPTSFGAEDWWWFGFGMGKCNGYSGWFGKDACTEIGNKINMNLSFPTNHSFFSDLEAVYVSIDTLAPLPPGTDPNYMAFPLFFNTNTPPWANSFHYCLSPAEMNYHYIATTGLLGLFKPLIDHSEPSLGYKQVVHTVLFPWERINSAGFIEISHSIVVIYGKSNPSSKWEPYYW